VKVNQAAEKAAAPGSSDATLLRALDDSATSLDNANKARDAVIKQKKYASHYTYQKGRSRRVGPHFHH
jgi:hypothetical protein